MKRLAGFQYFQIMRIPLTLRMDETYCGLKHWTLSLLLLNIVKLSLSYCLGHVKHYDDVCWCSGTVVTCSGWANVEEFSILINILYITSAGLRNDNKETSWNKLVGKCALLYTKIYIDIVRQKSNRTRSFGLSLWSRGYRPHFFRTGPRICKSGRVHLRNIVLVK